MWADCLGAWGIAAAWCRVLEPVWPAVQAAHERQGWGRNLGLLPDSGALEAALARFVAADDGALERAKALVADGRHAEALGVLASVGLGDELRGDVDTLRAAIQQELLSRLPEITAGAAAEDAGPPDTR